jgi:hypothetical protein
MLFILTELQGKTVISGWGFLFFFFFFLVGLNLGLRTYEADTLPLEPHIHSFLLWLFYKWGLKNCSSLLASNGDPPASASKVAKITGVNH